LIDLRHDPEFHAGVMRCVRCSICVPHCPSYSLYRNEADSPRGRVQLMRAVMEGRIEADENFELHIDRCLGCRACEDVCPSKVPYGKLLIQTREERLPTPHRRTRKRATEFFLRRIVVRPETLRVLASLLAIIQFLRLDRLARWLVRPFSRATARRIDLLPRVAGKPFEPSEVAVPETPTVAFHSGCIMAATLGDVQRAALRVLEQQRHAPVVPPGQHCCGALHQHAGLVDDARILARDTIAAFEDSEVPICTTAAGCSLAMKEYGRLLADDPEWAARAATFSTRIRDLSELVGANVGKPTEKIAVQEACHHWNVQQLRGRGLALLHNLGADAVALPFTCCGAAGMWSADHPEEAWKLLQPTLDSIEKSGCTVAAISNPGCLFHIRAGLRARKSSVRALHLAEVLDRPTPDEEQ
jgi:glycolate oxidase iron-sulfur subunit